MEIAKFQSSYYQELLDFSKKIWPEKPEEYLKYRLYEIPESPDDNGRNLLVINDEGRIVGCNLYFPTKARIKGKEEKVYWSHDTYVEEEYRGDAGMLLILESMKFKKVFGYGMTDVNRRIHEKLKTSMVAEVNQCFVFTPWTVRAVLILSKLRKGENVKTLRVPDKINVRRHSFRRIESVDELRIPDNGYWSGRGIDVEFVRDEHFLKKRFFENFIEYYFYKLETDDPSGNDVCYFVVRSLIEGGLPVLSIVDFRYNRSEIKHFSLIVKAAHKICSLNRLTLLTFRTSLTPKSFMDGLLVLKKRKTIPISTHLRFKNSLDMIITNADSDIDFLKE